MARAVRPQSLTVTEVGGGRSWVVPPSGVIGNTLPRWQTAGFSDAWGSPLRVPLADVFAGRVPAWFHKRPVFMHAVDGRVNRTPVRVAANLPTEDT